MAAIQRTKSTRAPANPGKPLTAPSTTIDAPKPTPIPSTTSNVSLFLTNLRLLNLDLLPDWPDINLLTFTNKDVAQGQKKRTQSVEWALYQLFVLWDPEEARNVR